MSPIHRRRGDFLYMVAPYGAGRSPDGALRVAPDLLARAALRDAGPADYGPVLPPAPLLVAAVAVAALAAVLLVWRVTSWRRRGGRAGPRPGAGRG